MQTQNKAIFQNEKLLFRVHLNAQYEFGVTRKFLLLNIKDSHVYFLAEIVAWYGILFKIYLYLISSKICGVLYLLKNMWKTEEIELNNTKRSGKKYNLNIVNKIKPKKIPPHTKLQ